MVDIGAGDAGDGDAAVLGEVDGVLLGQLLDLLGLEAGVGEHADLVGDVRPVVLGAEGLELLAEEGAHGDDAVSHLLDLALPLVVELGVVEDLGRKAGAVDGRVGVQGTDEDLELGVDALGLLGVLADDGEDTGTLTVETLDSKISTYVDAHKRHETYHVLGERLGKEDLVAILDELTNGKGVTVGVTAGKALVGHVEEGKVALVLADLGDLLPLLGRRVDTGGVVRAGVEEDRGTGRDGLEVGNQALKVKTDGVLVVVAVVLGLEGGVLEDGLVVGPGRGRDADLVLARAPSLEEGSTEAQGTSAGDGLGDGDPVEDRRVLAVGELGGGGGEVGHAGDASVLLVQLAVDDALLGLTDGGQDEGLAGVIAVGANACRRCALAAVPPMSVWEMELWCRGHTEVDLLAVGVGLESLGDT